MSNEADTCRRYVLPKLYEAGCGVEGGDDAENPIRRKKAVIVAICRRGRERQSVPILDLPLPSPKPTGWEWIEAYRHWARGGR